MGFLQDRKEEQRKMQRTTPRIVLRTESNNRSKILRAKLARIEGEQHFSTM
ncbi:hypothetical protein PAHAL_7G224800 [Panicum hallii]|jgi:hypothetical protein|uniref:Uncharacterized protein n=1 Tax=Panicum hallii TaxID=206008 RepID=A0A2T8ID85_9POAL|nr:hypothetical protein PAHAL_7G224800 [Panicum hallii]